MVVFLPGAGCGPSAAASGKSQPAKSGSLDSSSAFALPALREPLTTNGAAPVAHDNEVMALATHSGRLLAATDQWECAGRGAYRQILVKNSGQAPWRVFELTQSLRVQVVDSFRIPRLTERHGPHPPPSVLSLSTIRKV
jgi:hypothetical protein